MSFPFTSHRTMAEVHPKKRRARRVWTESRLTKFRQLWEAGTTLAEIADYFGVTYLAAKQAREHYGMPSRHRPKRRWAKAPVEPKPKNIVTVPPMPSVKSPVLPSDLPWPSKQQLMAGR